MQKDSTLCSRALSQSVQNNRVHHRVLFVYSLEFIEVGACILLENDHNIYANYITCLKWIKKGKASEGRFVLRIYFTKEVRVEQRLERVGELAT